MPGLSARAAVVALVAAVAVAVGVTPAIADASAQVSGLAPAYGPVGSTVDVTGTGLADATHVQFGSGGPTATLSYVDPSGTDVRAVVPAGAISGPVVVSGSGWTAPQTPTFTVQAPTSATLAGSAALVLYHQAVSLTSTLTSGGQPVSGQTAHLQLQRLGTTAWSTIGSPAITGSDGTAAFSVAAPDSAAYQVVFDASPSYSATTSPAVTVKVKPVVAIQAPNVAPILTRIPITGTVLPVPLGKVLLDRYYNGAWHAKQSVTVGKRGRYAFVVRFPATGTYTYRVRRPADAYHPLAGSSMRRIRAVNRDLRSGMHGPDVLALQRRLAALHYDLGRIDGTYGFDTMHAVTAFEKIQGLPRDGSVDRAVWNALVRPRVPHLRHPLRGAAVEIDLTRQVLYFAVNGRIARIFDSSTGGGYYYTGSDGTTQKAITPTGHFAVVYKVNHWVTSKLGTLYRPAYFNNDGYAIHGEDLVPPYPASHGCVRITVPAMDRLYNKLLPGVSVWIYRS